MSQFASPRKLYPVSGGSGLIRHRNSRCPRKPVVHKRAQAIDAAVSIKRRCSNRLPDNVIAKIENWHFEKTLTHGRSKKQSNKDIEVIISEEGLYMGRKTLLHMIRLTRAIVCAISIFPLLLGHFSHRRGLSG